MHHHWFVFSLTVSFLSFCFVFHYLFIFFFQVNLPNSGGMLLVAIKRQNKNKTPTFFCFLSFLFEFQTPKCKSGHGGARWGIGAKFRSLNLGSVSLGVFFL